MSETRTAGRYTYVCDGREVPVDETFSVEVDGRGLVVSSARTAPGTRLRVELVYRLDGSVEAVLSWTSDLAGTSPSAEFTYIWSGHGGTARGTVLDAEGGAQRSVSHDIEAVGGSFFPLMRVFSGRTLLRLVESGERGLDVVTPDIRDPRAVERWLSPLIDRRRVAGSTPEVLEVDGAERTCRSVEYLGGSYDQAATVWVDDGGLLLRYTWDQPGVGEWDVRLADVVGEWPRPVDW